MPVTSVFHKDALLKVLNDLSQEQVVEVFHFAIFLKEHFDAEPKQSPIVVVKTLPAAQLADLAGTVAWGGDALQDTERLYET